MAIEVAMPTKAKVLRRPTQTKFILQDSLFRLVFDPSAGRSFVEIVAGATQSLTVIGCGYGAVNGGGPCAFVIVQCTNLLTSFVRCTYYGLSFSRQHSASETRESRGP